METFTSRSQVLTFQECPRRGYIRYKIPTDGEVDGVVSSRLDMNLVVGSSFYRGVQSLYSGYSEDGAVGHALEGFGDWGGFWPQVKSRGLVLEDKEDAYYVYNEQAALAEALIRGYNRVVLPENLQRFDVVEIEQEDVGVFVGEGITVNFGARTDALLLEKDTQDLYILSLKTAKEHGKREEASAGHDMQGLSEVAVVEQRLRGWHETLKNANKDWVFNDREASFEASFEVPKEIPQWFIKRYLTGALPQVMGVKMEFALKGRRSEYPEGSGHYSYSNPLIRPWKKGDDLGQAYAFRYEFKDDFGANHRLGKGWSRVNIWEDMGVKAWVNMLERESLQGFDPGTAIRQQFVLPMEYFRNEEDMTDVIHEIIFQEKHFAEGLRELREGKNQRLVMAQYFPKRSRSCDWPTKCEYQEICYGPKQYLSDPVSSGLYSIRSANHPGEKKS